MKKACVIGWPIKHSRSPLIHKYWLEKYNLAGFYEKITVEPQNLQLFIEQMPNSQYTGCNVTIPHKESVFDLVTVTDPLALRIGAVNTVYIEDNTLYGLNTDGYGFVSNLKHGHPAINFNNMRCVIIGAGGASRAIIAALLAENISEIVLVNRTIEKSQKLADHFGGKITCARFEELDVVLGQTDLLINTTSLGMTGQPELEINLDYLPQKCVVTDIVYSPLETSLLTKAKQRGNPIVDGLGMLLHQAAPGFEKWFGVFPEVTQELRELIINDLGE